MLWHRELITLFDCKRRDKKRKEEKEKFGNCLLNLKKCNGYFVVLVKEEENTNMCPIFKTHIFEIGILALKAVIQRL
jgi:hypothetical protein